MAAVARFSNRFIIPSGAPGNLFRSYRPHRRSSCQSTQFRGGGGGGRLSDPDPIAPKLHRHGRLCYRAAPARASAGWLQGLRSKGKKPALPEIVKAGDPVLHQPAAEVPVDEIGSDRIQKTIEDMISVMRKAYGVGLAAPQIGVPLKIIVLEDTREYTSYCSKEEMEAQDRRPFDLLVMLNPKLKGKGNKTAFFFEGCLSVDGYWAVVERHLEVEVTGVGRDGRPMKVDATGWQARILQHECDHLEGTIYVDKMVQRTFRTLDNSERPLPVGCPSLGVH